MTDTHLRPRGFSELIDATFHLLRARFRAVATIGALMILPGAAMSLAMVRLMPDLMNPATNPAAMQAFGARFWGIMLLVAPISLAVYALGSGAIVAITSEAYLGRASDVSDGFAVARRRFWPVLGQLVLKWLALMAPFIVLGAVMAVVVGAAAAGGGKAGAAGGALIGGLVMLAWFVAMPILLLRWAMSMPVATLEQVGPVTALRRSGVLTNGSKWRLFGIYLVFFLLFMAIYIVGALIGGLTGALFSNPMLANVLGNVMSMVLYPVLAVLQTVIYYDLRIRNEGFDLEVMAGGLADAATLMSVGATSRQPA